MSSFEFSFGPSGGPKREAELFHLGVLADLSGQPADPLPGVASRKFVEFDIDNFDDRMRGIGPRLAFKVPNSVVGAGELDVALKFTCLDDFGPGPVTAQVGVLGKLWAARQQLARMRSKPEGQELQGKPQLEALLSKVLDDPQLVKAVLPSAGAPAEPAAPEPAQAAPADGTSDLDALLGMKPGDRPSRPPSSPIQQIVEQAMEGTARISDHAIQTIGALVDRLYEVYGAQLTLILRHQAFQALEGTWRGLNYLVTNVEMDELLKIRVLNVSKQDLAATLLRYPADENPLRLMMRHEPYGCLLGDYCFDHRTSDVAVLGGIASVAAGVDVPFVAAALPSLFGLAAWRDLRVTKELPGVLNDDAHAAWRDLGGSALSRHLFLTMPRFLARLPYGRKTNPPDGVEYEEPYDIGSPADFTWSNAAYGLGVVVTRAFSLEGWDARIAAGGEDCMIESLPVLTYKDRYGDTEMMCPTEVSFTVEAAVTLSACGLTPLLHMKNSDRAIFAYAPSLAKPRK